MKLQVFWNFMRTARFRAYGNSPALRVDGGFKAMSLPVTGKPFCSLKEGIIEGILKEKLGKECGVLEISVTEPDTNTVFEITI